MTTMNDLMKEHMADRPDAHTLAWWREMFAEQAKATRGVNHAVHLVLAEIEDQTALVKSLQGQVKSLSEGLHEAQAAIGRLQAETTELQGLMQKAREAYAAMRKETKVTG
jgi:uncharacterized protein YukE